MHEVNMRDKWGLYKKPYISWLGRHSRAKVRTNAIKLQDRQNAAQQQQCEDYIDQFRTLLPNLQLDMALVLVLVQDSSIPLNSAGVVPAQKSLAPPSKNRKFILLDMIFGTSRNNSQIGFFQSILFIF